MMNTLLTIAIPTFAVLLGVIYNRQDINALRADIAQMRKDMKADMAQLRKDIHGDMTQLRDAIHRDMVGLHERVAVVESKQSSDGD